jgi:hypothetical protein
MTHAQPNRFKSALKPKEVPDFAAIEAAVDEVADRHDVGNLTKPSDAPPTQVLQKASDNVTPMPRKEKPARKPSRAEEGKLSVMVPVYLLEAIDKKRTRNKTKRFIVLQAFKEAGFEVREADFMEDGRRGRE